MVLTVSNFPDDTLIMYFRY